jgi:ornithine cyclodeaminase
VDHVDQVLAESGDIQAGLESHVLEKHHLYPVSKFWADGLIPKYDNRDLVVFKSSGTAMQDLVVAYRVYRKAVEHDVGSLIHEFPAFRTLR